VRNKSRYFDVAAGKHPSQNTRSGLPQPHNRP